MMEIGDEIPIKKELFEQIKDFLIDRYLLQKNELEPSNHIILPLTKKQLKTFVRPLNELHVLIQKGKDESTLINICTFLAKQIIEDKEESVHLPHILIECIKKYKQPLPKISQDNLFSLLNNKVHNFRTHRVKTKTMVQKINIHNEVKGKVI